MFMLLLAVCLSIRSVQAEEQGIRVQIIDPYIELHTGAGEGYPVFHVIERHGWVEMLYRKMDWFKVRTRKGKIGWVRMDRMERTMAAPGVRARFGRMVFDDFANRRYEMGVMLGDFEGAEMMTLYGGFHFMPNLAIEGHVSQVTSLLSDVLVLNLNMVSTPFPKWRLAPFFSVGFGRIDNTPRSTVATGDKSSDNLVNVAVGVRYYLTRRFMIRAEAKQSIAFVDDDNNGEFFEWKTGFSFFY
jgi:hypothetical protein